MKLYFGYSSSPYAEKEAEYNLMFIRQQEIYINELLRSRGYVYCNQIYEMFGCRWDVMDENTCIVYDRGIRINFDIQAVDDGHEINITW